MKAVADFAELLAPVRAAARSLPREALPALCGALAAVQAEILLPAATVALGGDLARQDRTLTPEQAAAVVGRSRDWVYRHRHELPTTRLSSGRWVVSEARLRRWMEARSR
jgi:hypothetical protein